MLANVGEPIEIPDRSRLRRATRGPSADNPRSVREIAPIQRSQTRAPPRKQETTPSSLTLRTGPMPAGDHGGGGPGPFGDRRRARPRRRGGGSRRRRASGPVRSVAIAPSSPAKASRTGRVEVDDRPASGQVVQGPLGQGVAGVQLGGRPVGDLVREQVVRARSAGRSSDLGVVDHDEQAPLAAFGQVERRLEQDPGQPGIGRPPRPRPRTCSTGRGSASGRGRRRTACEPLAKSLISWFGLRTRQRLPPARVALAWLE